MSHLGRPPSGQQRDKPYREAYAWRLAAAGEDLMALRELAKAHIAKCKEGSRQTANGKIIAHLRLLSRGLSDAVTALSTVECGPFS